MRAILSFDRPLAKELRPVSSQDWRTGNGDAASVRSEKVLGLQRHRRNAPDVPPSHSDPRPVIIAVSALLELVEWIESRRKSCQGGVPCNVSRDMRFDREIPTPGLIAPQHRYS